MVTAGGGGCGEAEAAAEAEAARTWLGEEDGDCCEFTTRCSVCAEVLSRSCPLNTVLMAVSPLSTCPQKIN